MRAFAILAVIILALAAIPPVMGTPVGKGFTETTFASGFSVPTAIAFLPDGRMLVIEEGGGLYVVAGGTPTLLATIPVAGFPCLDFETGLLGVAVDPSFDTNGFIYLYRTNDHGNVCNFPPSGWTNEVVRVTMGPGDTVNLASLTTLLAGIRVESGYHNGGGLRVGPDGKLYVSVGELGNGDFGGGGPGTSTNIYAQDLNALEGKVLRLNLPDGSIPSDNPYFNQAGKRGEIWASGFRNPWRFGFDPVSGRLWLGDVGEEDIEELDIVVKGGNYSWPHCEGNLPTGCRHAREVAPILTYAHPATLPGEAAIMGGAFAGCLFGSFVNDYFYGDYELNTISHVKPNTARTGVSGSASDFVTNADGPVDIAFGPDGALYYVALNAGEIRRVAPVGLGASQPLSGKTLLLNGDPRKMLQVSSKDPAARGICGVDAPTLAGGSLRVVGLDFDDTYPLPASGWTPIGRPGAVKGFKYKDPQLVNGPISLMTLMDGKLFNATGKGSGLGHTIGATDPSPVDLILTIGTRRFCMSFGGTTKLVSGKSFRASNAAAPVGCLGD